MVSELISGLGLFKSMLETAKSLKDINDSNIRNAAVIDLQEKILSAQAEQASIMGRVHELEQELKQLKNWDKEKRRYQLHPVVPGCLAYVLKKSKAKNEPEHAICPNCYESGKKSILQDNHSLTIANHGLVCPSCKITLKSGGRRTWDLLVN